MVVLFTLTVFMGAALLFALQPMFARMVLPLLGGSPSVWNTAMVFYQATLLAGYAYAHWITRRLEPRRQWLLHGALLIAALVALPIGIPREWTPPGENNPVPWLVAVMVVAIGLPFFVVSATSPLLQRWFAGSGHRRAADPYFLFAASNLGSLLALVAYPVWIEPGLRLAEQSQWWTVGYVALAVMIIACGWLARRGTTTTAEETLPAMPVTWRRRGRWLLVAFAPCSLMLSVTTYITGAIAPVPLLWVIPLGVYLLSFVLVFAKHRWVSHQWMVRAMPLVVLAMPWTLANLLVGQPTEPLDWFILLHVTGLFVVAMVCHGELANDRPPASELTEFYLWVSAGGVLGGVFNALVAPWLFPTVFEYPLTLVLACALMPKRAKTGKWIGDIAWPVGLGLAAAGLTLWLGRHPFESPELNHLLVYWLPPALCLLFCRRPLRLALGIAVVLVSTTAPQWRHVETLHRARSFFGIHQVLASGEYHFLKHGCTVHGVQSTDPARRREPLAYFGRSGPLGEALAALPANLKQQVAVVGLGAGTVASYGETGQQWTFYEIDPVVEQIARDPRLFTFLSDSKANVRVVLGDARLSLQREPDGKFGVFIMDAYSADTPPVHLYTREALALYRRKLAPGGVLIFHISTSHLDLRSVLANLARDAGIFALHLIDFGNASARSHGQTVSRWMVMSDDTETLRPLAATGYWRTPRPQESVGVWTDDHASVFRAWSWR